MGTYLVVILIFGALIWVGIKVSTNLYKSGALGRRRFRLRRRGEAVELVPVESEVETAGIPVEVEEPVEVVPLDSL